MAVNFNLLVDFDNTLFDTKRFSSDLGKRIANQAGLSLKQVQADTERFHKNAILGGYDFLGHMNEYGLDLKQMWQHFEEIIRSTDYLYSDSSEFIQSLFSDGYKPSILSFGEEHFQRTKIIASLERLLGIGNPDAPKQHLNFKVVFRKKAEHIRETYPGQSGALVDDVPDQNLPSGFSEIHLNRSRNLAKPERTAHGFRVSNLSQARQAINLTNQAL